MKIWSFLAAALVIAPVLCFADAGDDTLKFYLDKSDAVVVGTILSEPMALFSELGVPNYLVDFKVLDVSKGDAKLKGQTIKVNIMRFEMDEKDHHPLIKKDAECIPFLKNAGDATRPRWQTSDFWFGIQYPSPSMVKSLKRLANQ